jgi:hypothetical protein
MRDVASKAATVESSGFLKIMDDIASVRAVPRPPIADGGYRVRNVRGERTRPTRATTFAPLMGKPMRMRGFLTALFAGGLGLAVLAGPVTCPACDPAHPHAQLDAKRIQSRLSFTLGDPADAGARETASLAQTDTAVDPALSAPAAAEPTDSASQISTAAISPSPERVPDSAPVAAAAEESAPHPAMLPDTLEQLSDQGPPTTEIAAATVESEPEAPLPHTTLPTKDMIGVDPEETPRASGPHKNISIKRRRTKARAIAPHNAAPSALKLYSSNKYAHVPGWAAKMFETNWQHKAFAYQYETHSLPSSALR